MQLEGRQASEVVGVRREIHIMQYVLKVVEWGFCLMKTERAVRLSWLSMMPQCGWVGDSQRFVVRKLIEDIIVDRILLSVLSSLTVVSMIAVRTVEIERYFGASEQKWRCI